MTDRQPAKPDDPGHHGQMPCGREGQRREAACQGEAAPPSTLSPTGDRWLSGHAGRRRRHAWPSSVVDQTRPDAVVAVIPELSDV